MGTVNNGLQTVMWRYRTPLVGKDLAMMQDALIRPGVYRGLEASRAGDSSIFITAGVAVLRDSAGVEGESAAVVKISFDQDFTVGCQYPNRYVVARFSWSDITENYADILTAATPLDTDIILAEVKYALSGSDWIIATVDKSIRSLGSLPILDAMWDNLRADPDPLHHRMVIVQPGRASVSGELVSYAGGSFAFQASATEAGRYDVLSLAPTGQLVVSQGLEEGGIPDPVLGTLPICSVHVTIDSDFLFAGDVIDYRPFLSSGGNVSFEDLSNGYDNEFGTTNPNQLSDIEVSVSGRDVLLRVTPQANLTNLLCYQAQVSLDKITWYPISSTGYDDTRPGSMSQFWTSTIEIKSLPHKLLSQGLYGSQTYWARVSQLTVANREGPWSALLEFSTIPITGEDLGVEVITDGNISSDSLVAKAASNYNARNDRIATVPADPIVSASGSAIDYTNNLDLSINLSFEWSFSGAGEAYDIDGFIVHAYVGASPVDHTFGTDPAAESQYFLAPDRCAFIMYGAPKDKYYTFGVQAYRTVDLDIEPTGILKSAIVKSNLSSERPYNPLVETAYSGDIGSTVSSPAALTVLDNTPPDATAAVALSSANADGSIAVSWSGFVDSGVGLLGYKIWRMSATSVVLVKEVASSILSFTDSTVTVGDWYRYAVAAYDRNGNECLRSLYSIATISAITGAPAAPTGLIASPGIGMVEVSFAPSASANFWYYLVMRSTDSGNTFPASGTFASRSNVYKDYGVTGPEAAIRYKVKTVLSSGQLSPDSAIVSLSPGAFISVPGDAPALIPSASHTTVANLDGSIRLSWPTVADTSWYMVFRQHQGEATWIFQALVSSLSVEYLDVFTTPGSQYRYAVRTVSAGGAVNYATFTDNISAYTLCVDTAPPAIPAFNVNPLVGAVRLSWITDRRKGSKYHVYRCSGAWLDGLSTLIDSCLCDGDSYLYYTDNLGVDVPANFSYKIKAEDAYGNISGFSPAPQTVSTSVIPDFPPDSTLELYWPFDDGGLVTTDLVTDLSRSGYVGRLRNAGSWVPGKSGSMLQFTGNGFVESETDVDLADETAVTYSFWLKSQSSGRVVFSHGQPLMTGCYLSLLADGAGQLTLSNLDGIDGVNDSYALTFPAGTFVDTLTPYMLVIDNATLRVVLYHDGDYGSSYLLPGTMRMPFGTYAQLFVAAGDEGVTPIIGAIDEFRIYSSALQARHAKGLAQYVTSSALGNLVAIGTQKYRSTMQPSTVPMPLAAYPTYATSGLLNMRLTWEPYVQGVIPANFLTIMWLSGLGPQGDPSLLNSSVTVAITAGEGSYTFEGLSPELTYSFAISAGRTSETGSVYTAPRALSTGGLPVWRNANVPSNPNFMGSVNNIAAAQIVSTTALAVATSGFATVLFGTGVQPSPLDGRPGDVWHNTETSAEWVKLSGFPGDAGGNWIIANLGAMSLRISGGTPTLFYDASGALLSTMLAHTVDAKRNGVVVTPASYSWNAYGCLSGSGTGATFTPTHAGYSTNPTYIQLTVVVDDTTYIDVYPVAVSRVGATGSTGAAGANTAIVYLYQRKTSVPAVTDIADPVTYTFASKLVTSGALGAWTATIPAGTDPIYVIAATAYGTGLADTIARSEWSSPSVLAQNGTTGTAGINSATVSLYKRAASTPVPTKPTVSTTYTFLSGALSGQDGGWVQSVPATNGNPLWVTTATAAANTPTDTILATEWAAPVIVAQDGIQGLQGVQGIQGIQGVTGSDALVATLNNDSMVVTTAADGSGGTYGGVNCQSTMKVYKGATLDTGWAFSKVDGTGVTSTINTTTGLCTITALTTDTGYVDVTATKASNPTLTCRITIAKSKTGAVGTTGSTGAASVDRWVTPSVGAIGKSISNVYNPTTVTFSAFSQTGAGSPSAYSGRFKISEYNGSTWTLKYTSAADEATKAYTPSAATGITAFKCELYLAGGVTTLLDTESIPVVVDGSTGVQGIQGLQGVQGIQGIQGVTGTRTASIELYQWLSSAPVGSWPTGSSTYTWLTGAFTLPATPNSWVAAPGAGAVGQTLYGVRATYSGNDSAGSSSIAWPASPTPFVVGQAGVNGTRIAVLEVYKWASSVPASLWPTGTSVYTWATGLFPLPATPNSWALTPGTPVNGQTLYAVRAVFSSTGTAATDTVTWPASPTPYPVGFAGSTARGVVLTGAVLAVAYNANGATPAPSSIVFTAAPRNVIGTATYQFFVNGSSVQAASGATTYPYTVPAAFSSMPVTVMVVLFEGGVEVARDQVSVVGIKPGQSAISIIITNSAHTIPADSDGLNGVYTNSGTDIQVYEGTSKLTIDNSPPYGSPSFRVAAAVTAGAIVLGTPVQTDTNDFYRMGQYSGMTSDAAAITFTVTVKNAAGVETTHTVVQTLSRTKFGADVFVAALTNEAHTIACDRMGQVLAGELGSGSPASCTVSVLKGATALGYGTGAGQWSITAITPVGCTVTQATNTFYLTSAWANSGKVTLTITIVGRTTLTRVFTFSKSNTGWQNPFNFSKIIPGTTPASPLVEGAGASGSAYSGLTQAVAVTGPFGDSVPVMECVGQALALGNGGFSNQLLTGDKTKKYRLSVYAYSVNLTGGMYFGPPSMTSQILTLAGAAADNPYFWSNQDLPQAGRWYLLTGYVYPAGYATTTMAPESGVYDVLTKTKISNLSAEFKFTATATQIGSRAFLYSTPDTAQRLRFYSPRIDVCDGTEPSIANLLEGSIVGPSVSLASSSMVARYNTFGANTTGNITVTATVKNNVLAMTSGSWSLPGLTLTTHYTVAANVLTILAAAFAVVNQVTVTATVDGVATDSLTIVRVNDGTVGPGVTTYSVRGTALYSAPSTIAKPSGTTAVWDSDCYSGQAFGYCTVSFKAGSTTGKFMVGLNTDPATALPGGADFSNLDRAFYCNTDGLSHIYESGTLVLSTGAYTTSSLFLITYDGRTVRYFIDGVLKREVVDAGKLFYADSSLCNVGTVINNFTFGPISPRGVSGIGLGVKVGYSDFVSGPPTYDGESYVHGLDEFGLPADIDGFIYYDNTPLLVKKGMVNSGAIGKFYIIVRLSDGLIGSAKYDYNTTTARLVYAGDVTTEKLGMATPALSGAVLVDALYVVIGTYENSAAEVTARAQLYDKAKRFRDIYTDSFAELFFRPAGASTGPELDNLISALGVTVFETLAARTAFVTNLFASSASFGKVTATNLAAGAVTADKLLIGDFTNLVLNPSADDGTAAGWSGFTAGTDDGKYLSRTAGVRDASITAFIPVAAGEKFYCYFEAAAVAPLGTANQLNFMLFTFDKNKATPGYPAPCYLAGVAGVWASASAVYTVPAGVCYVKVVMQVNGTSGDTAQIGVWKVRKVAFRRQANAVLIEDGAVTAVKINVTDLFASNAVIGKIRGSSLSVLATNLVNNVTLTGKLNGWGNVLEDGTGTPSLATYDATEKAVKLTTALNAAVRSVGFLVDHDKIYRVSYRFKKSAAHGTTRMGISASTAVLAGFEGAGVNASGSELITPVNYSTRALGTADANFYVDSAEVAGSTSYVEYTFFIVGSRRSELEFTSGATIGCAKLAATTTYVALRFLNWSNTVSTSLYVRDISVMDESCGLIAASNLVAGSVTTDKLFVRTSMGALNADPSFADASAWTFSGTMIQATVSDGKSGNTVCRGGIGQTVHNFSDYFNLDVSKKYRVRAWVRNVGGTGPLYLRLYQYNSSNTELGCGLGFEAVSAASVPSVWTQYVSAEITPVAGTIKGRLAILLNYNAGAGYMEAQDFRCEEVAPGVLIQDGAITADKIFVTNLAAIKGIIGVLSDGLKDPNNTWKLSDVPGDTDPVGYFRVGNGTDYIEYNPTTATFSVTGKIAANALSSFTKDANNFWNLATGDFKAGDATNYFRMSPSEKKIKSGSNFWDIASGEFSITLGDGKKFLLKPSDGTAELTNVPIRSYQGTGVQRRATQLDNDSLDFLDSPDGGTELLRARIGRLGVGGAILMDGEFNVGIATSWLNRGYIYESLRRHNNILYLNDGTLRRVCRNPSTMNLVQQRYTSLWESETVIQSYITSDYPYPYLAQLYNGDVKVFYRKANGYLYSRKLTTISGTSWDTEVQVVYIGVSNTPFIYLSLSDGFDMIFYADSSTNIIYEKTYNGSGWSNQVQVSNAAAYPASATVDDDGHIRCLYTMGTQYVAENKKINNLWSSSDTIIRSTTTLNPIYYKDVMMRLYIAYVDYYTRTTGLMSYDNNSWTDDGLTGITHLGDISVSCSPTDGSLMLVGDYFDGYPDPPDGYPIWATLQRYARIGAGIIESGGNDTNGRYIKYGDGTMVQWYVPPVTDAAGLNGWSVWGSEAPWYSSTKIWIYPVPFVPGYRPAVSGSGDVTAGIGEVVRYAAANNVSCVMIVQVTSTTTGAFGISFMATGRWKA